MTTRSSPKRKAAKGDRSARPGASRRSLLWRFRRFLFFVGVIVVASVVGGLWAASKVQVPTTNPVLDQTSFVCTAEVKQDCNESNAIASLHGEVNRVVVPLSKISPAMQNAILAAEDKDFFRHGGVDPVGIARAAYIDIRGGSTTHGGSTITQQYVKLTYLTSQRTFQRKIKEAVLSIKLEQELTKKQIFERYLNLVYFGRGAYGVEAAAQSYFGVDAKDLTLPQSAFLAGIIRNPTWARDDAKARTLRNLVLRNMADNHMISESQRAQAAAAPLGTVKYVPSVGVNWLGGSLGSTGSDPYAARYFVQSVIEDLTQKLGKDSVFNGGLRIYTTLEPARQKDAYNAVTSVLNFNDHPAGALVAIDNQGKVVAMMGGTDYSTSKFNLATGAKGARGRPVGSTFKAFALADLVRRGYSITSAVQADYKTTFLKSEYPILNEDWPLLSDCCTGGVASVVDATANSINSSYAKIMLTLGPESVDKTAHDLGIATPFESTGPDGKPQYLAGDVLGTHNIPVIDVADAYSTFARNGVQLDPVLVNRVEDRTGNVLATYASARNQVLSPSQNAKVVYALQQVIQRGTGTSADIGRPAAGKTGTNGADEAGASDTSGENKDAWFTGFVPGFTASVWMGYVDNRSMPGSYQGASFPAQIWKTFMKAALADVPPRDFPKSSTLSSGKFLTSWGGSTYLPPALTVKDYQNGSGPVATYQGTYQGGGQGGGQGGQSPGTTAPPATDGTRGSTPASTAPPATAPATTAAPPPPTDPPATAPPASGPPAP
jgi:penicillin-binding protein 1A